MDQEKPTAHAPQDAIARFWDHAAQQADLLARLGQLHGTALSKSLTDHLDATAKAFGAQAVKTDPLTLPAAFRDYLTDSAQRMTLYLDALRQRGDNAKRREAEGLKPVLVFDYDLVMDGADLPRPVNYSLVRITPPEGFPAPREDGRPWVIIDPRAGHGSGIGGFKSDSEVGVALADGHPVYFVIFKPRPEEGQTLADVTAAEAAFLREIIARHPNSPRPLITGNCQGGWASMILGATHPDLTGPIVIAGAPLSYWAGHVGRNPFRYYGGLAGGAVPALLSADMGGGLFDGASLVQNFEGLNPARTYWRKNYDLYAEVDEATERFLEFERWWSGFYFMTEAEIRWILENLFIGNKLTKGKAVMDDGTPIDLTRITAPVVVFASHGDNITPPQQALQWIADLYPTTEELRARGHVIVYTLHDSVGHLGIFVSAKIAKTQHKQITSVVKTIESLAPGLYEMIIGEEDREFTVEFQSRQISDISALGDGPEMAEEFAAVSALSDFGVKAYEMTLRPLLRDMISPQTAETIRQNHPMRQQMVAFSSENPVMEAVAQKAEEIRADRQKTTPENPFVQAEQALASVIERQLDLYRDSRDALIELSFHAIYGSPAARALSAHQPQEKPVDLRALPEVRETLSHIRDGGYPAAVVRMLILLARARGAVRRDRLEKSNALLHGHAPFDSMSETRRNAIIAEQGLIVDLAPEEAVSTLADLLPDDVSRLRAIDMVFNVAGPVDEMDARTLAMFNRFQSLLRTYALGWSHEDSEKAKAAAASAAE